MQSCKCVSPPRLPNMVWKSTWVHWCKHHACCSSRPPLPPLPCCTPFHCCFFKPVKTLTTYFVFKSLDIQNAIFILTLYMLLFPTMFFFYYLVANNNDNICDQIIFHLLFCYVNKSKSTKVSMCLFSIRSVFVSVGRWHGGREYKLEICVRAAVQWINQQVALVHYS